MTKPKDMFTYRCQVISINKFINTNTKYPKTQHSPYPAAPKTYGKAAQETMPPDESPNVGPDVITHVHTNFRSILYYARSVDPTISTLENEQ